MQLLLCGYEIRRTWKKEVTVYHAQYFGTWKTVTFLSKKDPNPNLLGSLLPLEEEDTKELRPFFPWRHPHDGMGPVRGYSVTYSPRYGIQAWAFVSLDTERGPRNLPVLMGSGRPRFSGTQDFALYWGDSVKNMMEEFPIGKFSFIGFDSKLNRHVMLDNYEPFEICSPLVMLDTESGGELQSGTSG